MAGSPWETAESFESTGVGRGMNPQPEWSEEEDAILIRQWPELTTAREIAGMLTGRSRDGVISRAKKLKLGPKAVKAPDWTDEEHTLLRAHWNDPLPLSQIAAAHFPTRSADAIYRMGKHNLKLGERQNFLGVKTPAQIARQSAAQTGKKRAAEERAAARARREAIEKAANVVELPVERPTLKGEVQAPMPERPHVWQVDHEVIPLLAITSRHCKWPIGDPSSDGFGFCGRRPGLNLPYCYDHAAVAYREGSTGSKAQAAAARPIKTAYGARR